MTGDRTPLRERLAEAVGLARNGPASDGRGWYRTAGDRLECLAVADAVLPVFEAETAALRKRAEEAEAAVERVRALAESMRTWCSPYGVAADYAARVLEALEPPKETP